MIARVDPPMTIQYAAEIVKRLGPCPISLDRSLHEELARELALMGCDVRDRDAEPSVRLPSLAAFVDWTAGTSPREITRSLGAAETLVVQSAGQARAPFEKALFDAGWERHPAGMMPGEYGGWNGHHLPRLSYYQRGRSDGAAGQLRKSGVEADGVIARYAMAAQHIRPGDHVLIDAKGSSDGRRVIAALSRAGKISRVSKNIRRFERDRPSNVDPALSSIGDNSIDMIVAFDPAVPINWVARLDDYARILKYDGRIVIGWRVDGDGVAVPENWAVFAEQMAERFLLETRYVQMPISPDPAGPSALAPIALDQDIAGHWFFLVASANPLMGEGHRDSYRHPAFSSALEPIPQLVDFGAAYDNPYLYRAMVQMGERLSDDVKLARLAECVIEDSRPDSADRGAALAVLGYRVLEMRMLDAVPTLIALIKDYATPSGANDASPHVGRWRISLSFLAGRLSELVGDREAAKHWYDRASIGDWGAFSALLATKAVAACFYGARLRLAESDEEGALAGFRRGVDIALRAAAVPHAEQMGSPEQPLPFYLQELAEVIDMGSQCANAVAHFHLWPDQPGLFWRQVDVRRFGLASWARDLERENQRLTTRS